MYFVSTANRQLRANASEAMSQGLAPDGRLYVPERFPELNIADFDGAETIAEIGARLLAPFFEGDMLEGRLEEICDEAFNFEIPLRRLDSGTSVLELFHGPTAAFKDVGARFLASCSSRINEGSASALTILVATSGDTGGAVAAAFHGKPNVEVFVLYPKGRVSDRQEKQLTCWDKNITTFAVEGVFDDCQRMVKGAFAHEWWKTNKRLSSANSINIGRLLPQMVYYAASSLWRHRETGELANYIIPSGNAGNVCACVWARECGLPIGEVKLATNANPTISEYFETGVYRPRATIATLANAMDVGDPSNMERLRALWPEIATMRERLSVSSVTDEEIEAQIRSGEPRWGEVWCPHTACAVEVRGELKGDWIIVSTAHPAKFDDVVEPLVGHRIELPEELERLLDLPNRAYEIEASLEAMTSWCASDLELTEQDQESIE